MTTGQFPKRRETDEQAARRIAALNERREIGVPTPPFDRREFDERVARSRSEHFGLPLDQVRKGMGLA